jgi:hypothetical protein
MRLMAMFFLNPRIDSATPPDTSAHASGRATRSVMRGIDYRPSFTGTADAITKAQAAAQ